VRPEDNIDVFDAKIKIKIERKHRFYHVRIYLPKILDWFEKITLESLFAVLQLTRIYPPPGL